MAVPKGKVSKQRKRKRRTHWKLTAPTIVRCQNCGEYKRPHRVCPECGTYKGEKIVAVEE